MMECAKLHGNQETIPQEAGVRPLMFRSSCFRSRLWTALSSASALGVLCAPGQAAAQAGPADNAAIVGVEEITVTARRRSESLQTTPIAVTAVSSAALEERNVQSTTEITNMAPNVQFDGVASESGGGASSQISIRGIGQTDFVITVEPGVGLYMDGVYIGKSVGSLMDAVDLEQIEVLRGPQGTLFGKNTIGGAVLLTSKRPSDHFELGAEVSGGSFDRFDLKGFINIPVSDRLRVRASGALLTRDGIVKRILTGGHQGNKNALSGRVVTELDVTDSLLATLAVDGTRSREQSPAQITVAVDENALFPFIHNTLAYPACDPTIPGNTARFSNPDCANNQYARKISSRENSNTGPNQSDADIWGASLTLKWDGDPVSLKSITAYRHASVTTAQETDGIPAYTTNLYQRIKLEQLSQEFQASGKMFDDRLNFVVGLFGFKEKGRQVFPVELAPVTFTSGGRIRNESYAAFGQVSYKITDAASITLGGRYSYEKKRYRPEQQIDSVRAFYQPYFDALAAATNNVFLVRPGLPLFPRVWVSTTDKRFTPSLTFDYRFSRSVMAYASYSKGFKGGGFTMRGFPPVIPGVNTTETDPNKLIPSFNPETAEVIEVGVKSDLFDRRLRLNIAGFTTNYKDLQLTANTGVSALVPVLINAGDARIKGVEVEAEVVPTGWLRINGGLGYLHNQFKSLTPAAISAGASLSKKLPNSPEWTLTGGTSIDIFKNDSGSLSLRGDVAYKSSQFKTVGNDIALRQNNYAIVNGSLSYATGDGHWKIVAGVTNLTDKIYIVSGATNGGVGNTQAVIARPREFFLTVRFNY